MKIHQLRRAWSKNPPTAVWRHSSWWVFRKGTSQLVDFSEKHFAAGGFLLGGIENFPQLWGKYRMETHTQKEWPLFVQEVFNVTSLILQAYCYSCHEGPLCGCKYSRSSYTFPAIIAEHFMFQQYMGKSMSKQHRVGHDPLGFWWNLPRLVVLISKEAR